MTGSYGLIEFGNWTGNTNYSAAYQDVRATAGSSFLPRFIRHDQLRSDRFGELRFSEVGILRREHNFLDLFRQRIR